MHKQFRELLEKATGKSEHIIAIVIDVRGFTSFCQTVDSLDTAIYIKKIYMKMIDDYFSTASYFKPTGDGLLVIVPYDEQSLKETLKNTVKSCISLVDNFAHLCADDKMINFSTPDKIGIGIARGSACCITSEGKILDYSGKVLNLASRLMEISRPSGITFDESLGYDLMDELKGFFAKDCVYIRSVAEEKPLTIYFTKDCTLVSNIYKQPIKEPQWTTQEVKMTFQKFKALKPNYAMTLKNKPLDKDKIICSIECPTIEDHRIVKGFTHTFRTRLGGRSAHYKQEGREHEVFFAVKPILRRLESYGVTDEMVLKFRVKYAMTA